MYFSTVAAGRPLWKSLALLMLCLLLFFIAIEWMSESFTLFGDDMARQFFTYTSNPIIAILIGIASTSIVQSSGATSSIVVAMVASGTLELQMAVYIIMGANIGSTVTNIIVSLAHINRSNEFRRAFAASTVHDFYNILCVVVFLPLELATGFLAKLGLFMAKLVEGVHGLELLSPLKLVTGPAVDGVIGLLQRLMPDTWWHSQAWTSLAIAITLLFVTILTLVHVLKTLAFNKAETWFEERIFHSTSRSFFIGILLTMAVCSSGVTTSLVVPFAGAGLLTMRQIYPYMLGANIGTTFTAMLAALSTQNPLAVAIAMVHTMFNILGAVIFLPLSALPIWMATTLADLSSRNKFIPFVFVLVTFFIVPIGCIFLLK